MQTLRDLGVTRVRVNVTWNEIAPSPHSTRRPKGFNAINPAAYPAGGWAPYDAVVRAAAADGIGVYFTLNAPAPLWATGSGAPKGTAGYFREDWEPSAKEFGYFVKAVGHPLQRVLQAGRLGDRAAARELLVDLERAELRLRHRPQGTGPHQTIPNSPRIYRDLVDAAWSSLQATGHTTRTDKILFGEVTPARREHLGRVLEHEAADLPALAVLRRLELPRAARLGGAALGCPTTAGGSRGFRGRTRRCSAPAGSPSTPTRRHRPRTSRLHLCGTKLCAGRSDPDFADLPEVPRLEPDARPAERDLRLAHPFPGVEHRIRLPDDRPPDPQRGGQPGERPPIYMNWAEYLSYKQSRTYSYSQYALIDQAPPAYVRHRADQPEREPEARIRRPTGCRCCCRARSTRKGRKLEVWGGVRPAALRQAGHRSGAERPHRVPGRLDGRVAR